MLSINNNKTYIKIIAIIISFIFFLGHIAYSLPNYALRKPLIFSSEKELLKHLCHTIAVTISDTISNKGDVETALKDRGFFDEIKAWRIIWDVDENGDYWVYQHDNGIYLKIDKNGSIKEDELFDRTGIAKNKVGERLAIAYYQKALNMFDERIKQLIHRSKLKLIGSILVDGSFRSINYHKPRLGIHRNKTLGEVKTNERHKQWSSDIDIILPLDWTGDVDIWNPAFNSEVQHLKQSPHLGFCNPGTYEDVH